ncbi:MAG TPA: XdhC family protein [Vicinamibacterales bacterium]|nr:XdhC family protein [Vicinamibacterales bacterium]
MNEEVFAAANEALARGETVALVTIVRAQGSTPQRVGSKMLVYADGRTVGTIGGGCYEHDAFWKARDAIANGQPSLVRYELSDDFAEENGLICGGQMEVYIEPLAAAPHLYVIGAGHVGWHLARLAREAGFRIHVVDDREKFANAERFPDAAEIVVDDIASWLESAAIPPDAYVTVVTRGHQHDFTALRALVRRPLRYLGMIGSRAKVTRVYDALAAEGIPSEAMKRVRAPIGLDIGAVTPAEIAVSILAEMIAVRHGKAADAAIAPLRYEPKVKGANAATVESPAPKA